MLWVVSSNFLNGTLPCWRMTSSGAVISSAFVALPGVTDNQVQSFAVDSAGNGYLSFYSNYYTGAQGGAFQISPTFQVDSVDPTCRLH